MISHQTPYFIVHSDGAGFVVRVQRTGLEFPDIATMERDMDAIIVALDRLGRDRKGLCIDWREGPLRNDTPFEDTIRRTIPRMVRGYRAVAVIARSAVGALQVKRLFREASFVGEVFQDESEALDYLRGSAGVMSRRPTPIPPGERSVPTNARGDRMSTAQLQAIERVSATAGARTERHSSLPPMPSERPNAQSAGRDRMSTVPPQPAERISQLPNPEDRPSSLPLPPPARPPRTH
ncbi:MAG: hypothetical protein IPM54_18775 [Polyangiaceae bacterium]|nr:hypothetical protein [Polyangiaceae bacterium]